MAHVETGAVPIVENGKVVGLVTDRDIVLRVVAEGRSLDCPISEAMSEGDVQSVRKMTSWPTPPPRWTATRSAAWSCSTRPET